MALTEFLLARIAEDETASRAALSGNLATRVLAECEAKRQIVETHYFMAGHKSRDFGFSNGTCLTCRVQGPCPTLRLLALPYADHPDYQQEWKP